MNKLSISNNDFMNCYLNIGRQIKINRYCKKFHQIYFYSSSNKLYLTSLGLDYSATFQRKVLFSIETKIQRKANSLSDNMISTVY